MLAREFLLKTSAVIWLLLISVLFFLPGAALPGKTWLDIPHFDKLVHFGFFTVLLFLWRFRFNPAVKYNYLLLLGALFYGLAVEVVQHYLIANRSFDVKDVFADMVGATVGIFIWEGYKKNRPL